MNTLRIPLLVAALTLGLAACHQEPATPASKTSTGVGDGIGDGIGDSVGRSMADAKRKLETENLKIEQGGRRAEITPAGDLIIDGRPIPVNAEQRALLLEHRTQMLDIARAGMDIGTQGAKLAGKAVTEAITGIFSGNPERIQQRVEAQAEGIKQSARALCDRLPAMYETQQRLAKALPDFAPFAKMEPSDIRDCAKDLDKPDAPTPPSPPSPPTPPVNTGDAANAQAVTARDVFGKPELPKPPKPPKAADLLGG